MSRKVATSKGYCGGFKSNKNGRKRDDEQAAKSDTSNSLQEPIVKNRKLY